jgi:hypothetical protein
MATTPEQTQEDLAIQNSVAVLMKDLPQPVQDFLAGPQRDATTLRLSQRYGLHADQAGKFEMAFIYMLLGISKPEEFIESLRSAGIAPETIKNLAHDINEEVFKPLQKKEREDPSIVTPGPIPAATPLPIASPEKTILPSPPIYQPAPPVLQREPPFIPKIPVSQSQSEPEVRTMAGDMAIVQSGGHVPETLQPSSPVHQPVPATPVPASSVPGPLPPLARKPAPPSNENRDALHAVLKEYGIDPYREPPE